MSSSRSAPAIELRAPGLAPGAALNDQLVAFLDDFSPAAIEDGVGACRVFFFSGAARDRAAGALADFAAAAGGDLRRVDVPDENWAQRSQASLRAVEIGRLIIAPPWDRPAAGHVHSSIVITILPSTGFGTGHHESTRLALMALEATHVERRSVIDVGTGSGVLAIAAVRLGAAPVLAIDADQDAIEAAVDNVTLNAPLDGLTVRHMDLEAITSERADVVCANLTGPLIARQSERLADLVRAGGALILSGFTREEEAAVRSAFGMDMPTTARFQEAEWVALVLGRPAVPSGIPL